MNRTIQQRAYHEHSHMGPPVQSGIDTDRWSDRRQWLTVAAIALGMPALIAWVLLTVVPPVEDDLKASADVAKVVHKHFQPTDPLYMIDYDEPTLFFYLNRPVGYPVVSLRAPQVADWAFGREAFAAAQSPPPDDPHARREPGGALIISRTMLERIEADHGPLPIQVLWAKSIYDYPKGGRRKEILLVSPTDASVD